MTITPEEVAKLATAATEGPLTQIEQLRLHIECDLSPPCLDSLLDEIDAMEAKLAKADAMVAAALERASAEIAPLLSSALAAKQQAHTMDYEQAMGERADGLELALRRIRALITDDAQTALAKMLSEARAKGMREAAEVMRRSDYKHEAHADILAAEDAIQKEGGA